MEESDFEGFSGESSTGEEDHDSIRENLYYLAKSQRDRDPAKAICSLKTLLEDQESSPLKQNWEFKAIKQLVKIMCTQSVQLDETFTKLIGYQDTMAKPYFAKSIVNLIDFVYSKPNQYTSGFYEFIVQNIRTLIADGELQQRILAKGAIRLGRTLIDTKEYEKAIQVVQAQLDSIVTLEEAADVQRAALIAEMNALLLEAHFYCSHFQQVKAIYWEFVKYKSSSLVHPLIVAQMAEFYGRVMLHQDNHKEAVSCLFESFKSYDETGSVRKMTVIVYLLLAQALLNPDVDPFGSQELAVYKANQQIQSLVQLIEANRTLNAGRFASASTELQNIHKDNQFVLDYLKRIHARLQERIIISFINSNSEVTSIPLTDISSQDSLQDLVVKMLLLGKLKGYKLDCPSNSLVKNDAFIWYLFDYLFNFRKYEKFNANLIKYAEALTQTAKNLVLPNQFDAYNAQKFRMTL